MRRSRKILLAGAIVVVFGLLLASRPDDEPSYNGRKLSYWLKTYNLSNRRAEQLEAEQAIKSIGTNALPCLVRWIGNDKAPSRLQQGVVRLLAKKPALFQRKLAGKLLGALMRDPARERPGFTTTAFSLLGTNACPAVPQLERLATATPSGPNAGTASEALGLIGGPALPALLSVITNRQSYGRFEA